MKNSCRDGAAKASLDRMRRLLSEEALQREVDEPLDDAAARFECGEAACTAPAGFVDVLGRFVAHLYRNAPHLPMHLTEAQARAEALYIIESGYPSKSGEAFEEAYLHVQDLNFDGLPLVLGTVKEIIRARRRRDYFAGILEGELDPLDWAKKRCIAALMQQDLAEYSSESVRSLGATEALEAFDDLLGEVLYLERFRQSYSEEGRDF